jgi:hypothetical protein
MENKILEQYYVGSMLFSIVRIDIYILWYFTLFSIVSSVVPVCKMASVGFYLLYNSI